MTQESVETGQGINDMDSAQKADSSAPRTLEGEFVERRRRRRLDLKTLPGELRESAKIYRELAEGKISMAQAEVRSRVLRRHTEALAAHEQQLYLAAIDEKLRALQGPASTQLLPIPKPLPHSDVD